MQRASPATAAVLRYERSGQEPNMAPLGSWPARRVTSARCHEDLTLTPLSVRAGVAASASGAAFGGATAAGGDGRAFSGNCPCTSMALVIIPAMPTSASCDFQSSDMWAVWMIRSKCFVANFKQVISSGLFSSLAARAKNFFIWKMMPKTFDKQNTLRPSWMVPDPARFPPGKIFHCFKRPMWSMMKNAANKVLVSTSSTRSTGSSRARLLGMLWMTGTSLNQRWVRLAAVRFVIDVRATSSSLNILEPAVGALKLMKPRRARHMYWKNLASLSLPSALLQTVFKQSTRSCVIATEASEGTC
mmetsp:Transcript_45920/g.132443  ORF Transcript_45920/g.132443 Transcript_45920/m.132443 type:complete len:302 (-) Transcript_45920:61-966(-)